jgi:hypothetical protein
MSYFVASSDTRNYDMNKERHTLFEVRTVVNVEITAFWDGMLCSSVDRHHVSEQYSASILREEKTRDYSSTLKSEAASSSETLVPVYRTMWHHILETVLFK